ncbi:transmembrane protein 209-like [Pelomyxa schiedti]|nr:transmembrane protein 209-like [Pelomyxa schiedti]KAH3757986.1 transmembrane protein 209-like [Pelomyxa schiedti]
MFRGLRSTLIVLDWTFVHYLAYTISVALLARSAYICAYQMYSRLSSESPTTTTTTPPTPQQNLPVTPALTPAPSDPRLRLQQTARTLSVTPIRLEQTAPSLLSGQIQFGQQRLDFSQTPLRQSQRFSEFAPADFNEGTSPGFECEFTEIFQPKEYQPAPPCPAASSAGAAVILSCNSPDYKAESLRRLSELVAGRIPDCTDKMKQWLMAYVFIPLVSQTDANASRFTNITRYPFSETYIKHRVAELSRGGNLMPDYTWNGGSSGGVKWTNQHPTDAILVFHLFYTYLDLFFPFSQNHVVLFEQPKDALTKGIAILQKDLSPPHYEVVYDGNKIPVYPGPNNLFYSIITMLALAKNELHGVIGSCSLRQLKLMAILE